MYLIEPFGGLVTDRRHGVATAILANAHFGNPDKHYTAEEFMLGNADLVEADDEDEPEFIDDPVAQSNLIRAAIFGIAPKQ